jgi:hypothetical protein
MWQARGAAARRSTSPSEHAIPAALDHLHTSTPALAGFASKVVTPPTTSGGQSTHTTPARRDQRLARHPFSSTFTTVTKWRAVLALTAVAVLAGVTFPLRPAGAATATSNRVTAHGAPDLGSPPTTLTKPAVGVAATPSHKGYWVVASDGGIFSFGDARFFGSTGAIALARPIVGMASTPTGRGYWLVADDGGVFSFGDAHFFGSLGDRTLRAPITGIAASPTGDGYWLVARDGGVFSFGDARFWGSAGSVRLRSAVAGMTATRDGDGYYLVAQDGGVFAFGHAKFEGAALDPTAAPVVGIASGTDGDGYVVTREDGRVYTFGTPYHGDAANIGDAPVVGIATSADGYWLAHGTQPASDLSQLPFLSCTRHHESDTSGGYHAVSASGTYRGAYQFSRSTWDNTARRVGRFDLVGMDPAVAAPADQDLLAWSLYTWQGAAPWGGRCSGM